MSGRSSSSTVLGDGVIVNAILRCESHAAVAVRQPIAAHLLADRVVLLAGGVCGRGESAVAGVGGDLGVRAEADCWTSATE